MLTFITSERSKPKLSHGGFLYNFHREKSSGSITWRCEMNSKYYRDRELSCSGTVSTTGSSPNSTLEWARDHIHPPDNSKIRARVICQDVRERATTEPTATPQLTTTDSLIGAAPDVNLSLPLLLRAYLDWYTCGAQRAAESTYVPSCYVERPRASLHSDDSDHQRSRVVSTPCSAASIRLSGCS